MFEVIDESVCSPVLVLHARQSTMKISVHLSVTPTQYDNGDSQQHTYSQPAYGCWFYIINSSKPNQRRIHINATVSRIHLPL